MERSLALYLGLALLLSGFASPGYAEDAEPEISPAQIEDSGNILTPWEVLLLYEGKTWKWPMGAGYFSADGRQFTGLSQAGPGEQYVGTGAWQILKTGEMCINADWQSAGETFPKLDCFMHRELDGNIFQKDRSSGNWYLFKEEADNEAGEYRNFVEGNHVAAYSTDAARQVQN